MLSNAEAQFHKPPPPPKKKAFKPFLMQTLIPSKWSHQHYGHITKSTIRKLGCTLYLLRKVEEQRMEPKTSELYFILAFRLNIIFINITFKLPMK